MTSRSGNITSWGNVARGQHVLLSQRSRFDPFPSLEDARTVLPFGQGRSYGDSCLNVGGALVLTRALDRFIRFDRLNGILTCESGVLLSEILEHVVPEGWFLPVVPGTQHITVGGAIANDVHGKNHHHAGTFACYVREIELMRSDGERLRCSPQRDPYMFAATMGGLGLTGLILTATLQLRTVPSECMDVESVRFGHIDEFLALSKESDDKFEYTVAWIDCLASGANLGRGVFQRANHAAAAGAARTRPPAQLTLPFRPPFSLVNPLSLRLFNTIHFHRAPNRWLQSRQHYETFFFPLDHIRHWNRLYGPRGFHQYQCIVPEREARATVSALLEAVSKGGVGSFLAVLKRCGSQESPGLLSFPLPGLTLALDFPHHSSQLPSLFEKLDAIVLEAGGRLYPAKDGRMPARMFQAGFPAWPRHASFVDPRFSSNFWRRVTGRAA